jgi:hypothetical protein
MMENFTKDPSKVLYAVLVGVAITLVSEIFFTPHFGRIPIDMLEWGTPLPWITRVIPTKIGVIHWISFVIDLVFWIIISLIVLGIIISVINRRSSSRTKSVLRLFSVR